MAEGRPLAAVTKGARGASDACYGRDDNQEPLRPMGAIQRPRPPVILENFACIRFIASMLTSSTPSLSIHSAERGQCSKCSTPDHNLSFVYR